MESNLNSHWRKYCVPPLMIHQKRKEPVWKVWMKPPYNPDVPLSEYLLFQYLKISFNDVQKRSESVFAQRNLKKLCIGETMDVPKIDKYGFT